jgi:hypothetical protein
VMV